MTSCSVRKQVWLWSSALLLASAPVVSRASPPEPRQGRPAPLPGDLIPDDLDVQATGEHTYQVRPKANAYHRRPCTPTQDARIVPAFKEGKPVGFKLFSVRPDSVFTKLGLQERDIIQAINGITLDSPGKVMEVYEQLDTATRVEVDLDRGGTPIRKTYAVAR
ncbi:hypothetical protein LZ198_28250 [Myxococcus sp. K15C18031901]|uniref:hypothetical protein n=1 Tax=Myxococcus dinghuensis TaxID=2906761 RepID=UPI0020A73FD2|nr:hypothetical protein [Myxococcus dinghuensis]MCP3102775.1 hypothetical protein [Myxococcus dinghuensis]